MGSKYRSRGSLHWSRPLAVCPRAWIKHCGHHPAEYLGRHRNGGGRCDGRPIRGATGADSLSIQTNRQASLRLAERCADILISIRSEIADAGYTVAERLRSPIAKLVECVPPALIQLGAFHLTCHSIQCVRRSPPVPRQAGQTTFP